MKPWWRSKTIWFNVLVVAATALAAMADSPILVGYKEEILMIVGAINTFLRFTTKTGVR